MDNEVFSENFVQHLSQFIGKTVTIFTTSGGQSGQGFTGVVLGVNNSFVQLITRIGSAPGNALGNTMNSHCQNDSNRFNTGTVTDIPINRIASFVHDAI